MAWEVAQPPAPAHPPTPSGDASRPPARAPACACRLVKIARVLGTDELYSYLAKYGIELDPQLEALIGQHTKKPWSK